jgi:hypothetical protein
MKIQGTGSKNIKDLSRMSHSLKNNIQYSQMKTKKYGLLIILKQFISRRKQITHNEQPHKIVG